jgi:hypothetical protein
MQIRYQCPHCDRWHEMNDWTKADIQSYIDMLMRNDAPAMTPFDRNEWIRILKAELNRRAKYVF